MIAPNKSLMRGLEQMLNELQSYQLVTVLVPCKRYVNEGGCIRVNMSENPKWYRALCARHPSKRQIRRGKFDTVIRRHRIEQALKTMLKGGRVQSLYADELKRIAAKLNVTHTRM